MRFYLDEQLDIVIARESVAHGLDVVCARDAGMLGEMDRDHLSYAASQGRAIVTADLGDFGELSKQFAREDLPHAGVLLVANSLRSASVGRFIRALQRYAEMHPEGMTAYMVEFLRRVD